LNVFIYKVKIVFIEPSPFYLNHEIFFPRRGEERERDKDRNKLNKFIVDKLNREVWLECKF